MDFLWKKVSEKEKEEIQKKAKTMMDSFSKRLSKIDKNIKAPLIERGIGEREESIEESNDDFSRKIMFENAQNKNKDFVIAEKGGWREE
ncbi:MAG: hypothetical protein KKF68_03395 [Nanoarchaeota archaeon]|nr:hypothetical protein [Nanoarchaeota archaeon]